MVLNVCVLLYVCAHFGASGPWIEEPNYVAQVPAEALYATRANLTAPKDSLVSSSSTSFSPTKDLANSNVNDTAKDKIEIKNQTVIKQIFTLNFL